VTNLLADLRYAVRVLRKSPGFTAVAIVALAIGIGANVTIFSIANTFVLRQLPIADPSSAIRVYRYANHDYPVTDLQALFEHIHECAESLRIDPARVGVIAASGNVPTALTTIMQDARRTPACAVFSCGCLLDLDGATDVADAARQFGFANPGGGRTVADLRRDVPLLITRAGRDQFPATNASIDRFIRQGLVQNLPITFVNHAEGPHAFDLFDDSRTSRDIVRQTLQFLRQHLTAED
jgi:hypothetical protein